MSLNSVVLIGNLTADVELKYTDQGTARGRFSLALNRYYTDREGNRQEETTFVPVVVWGKQAENCANYLGKGRQAAVEGRLRIDSFTPEGEEKPVKVVEVVANNVQFLSGGANAGQTNGNNGASESEDEEIPF